MTLTHVTLKIAYGLPQEFTSVQQVPSPYEEIDFLNPNGFSVRAFEGYNPAYPELKSGGLWLDNPAMDGRVLLSGAVENVTDTIELTLNANSWQTMATWLNNLRRFQRLTLDYWTSEVKIEPVYLVHQYEGEPGARYALISNIEMQLETPDIESFSRDVTLEIEREAGWRAHVPPGANPMFWTAYARNVVYSAADFTILPLPALASDMHLVRADIQNSAERNGVNTFSAVNYIEIPAADIPGDMPALCMISTNLDTVLSSVTFAVRTGNPTNTITDEAGVEVNQSFDFAASDASTLGTDATLVNDTTALRSYASATRQRGNVSFGTSNALVRRFRWAQGAGLPRYMMNLMRGVYAVYVRAYQAVASTGTINMQVRVGYDNQLIYTPLTTAVYGGVGGDWMLHYMGEVVLPPQGRQRVGVDGLGLDNPIDTSADFVLELWAERPVTTGSPQLRVCDILLLPIDEGNVFAYLTSTSSANTGLVLDTTGYFGRGIIDPIVLGDGNDGGSINGYGVMLQPNVNNRIYCLNASPTGLVQTPLGAFSVSVDIVPRFSGVRTV